MESIGDNPEPLPYRIRRGLLSIAEDGRSLGRLLRALVVLLLLFGADGAQARALLTVIGLPLSDSAARAVIEEYTLARQLKPVRFAGTLKTADWLMDRPVLAATLARHLYPSLERYHVTEAEDGRFQIDDMGSVRGSFRLVARAPERRMYFVEGSFRSLADLLKLSGSMVFTLHYRERWEEGEAQVEVEPQLYLRIDGAVAHGVLKVLAPLLHGTIDRRVASLTEASHAVGARLSQDPQGLYREMQTWPEVRPGDLAAYRQAFHVPEEAK
jgi:hypothetical protein